MKTDCQHKNNRQPELFSGCICFLLFDLLIFKVFEKPSKNMKKSLLMLCCLSLLTACHFKDDKQPTIITHPESEAQAKRPIINKPIKKNIRIGLALGGGASKGFAHIGVIRVLEENQIPISIVTGTSAGAVVGSLYASGMNGARLQSEAEQIEKSDVADFRLSTKGFIKGDKLQNFINEKVAHLPIQKFPKRFAAIATNFENGKSIVFNYGNTGQAVRASASIPNIFQPVKIGENHYVDGGLSAPVPVSAARQLGADFVIAVDISDKPEPNRKKGFFASLGQTLSIMSQTSLTNELAKADIVIRPNVLEMGAVGGFEKREDAIKRGELATRELLPQIRAKIKAVQTAQ